MVGHSPKVLSEYYNLIKDYADVSIAAPSVYTPVLPAGAEDVALLLPKKIVMTSQTGIVGKIANKFHMFTNIKKAISYSDAEVLWFYNVEYYMMLYMMFHKKPDKRIVCTMFRDRYSGGKLGRIRQWVFERAQKKIDLIVATGPGLQYKNCKSVFIPDYFYEPTVYEQYANVEKKEQVVCLGTMGDGKLLEELVKAFNDVHYRLIIAGRFYDKQRLQRLKDAARSNITIIDEYIPVRKYYELLAQSKYTVLPYNPKVYNTQTSGVMQEAMFLGTVPIAFGKVLEGSGIPGAAIEAFNNINDEFLYTDRTDICAKYKALIEQRYTREVIEAGYREAFGI